MKVDTIILLNVAQETQILPALPGCSVSMYRLPKIGKEPM